MVTRRGLPGSGLLTAPLRAAADGARAAVTVTAVATGSAGAAALLGGSVAASIGGSLARATPDVSALARAAAGMAIEAFGGPPVRRVSSRGARLWIEVRGLDGEHAAVIAADVPAAVRATPGVREAVLNRTLGRLVVTLDPEAADAPSAAELSRVVAAAERPDRTRAARAHPNSLPGDDALLMGRVVAAAAAAAGLGLSLTGSLLRLPRLPDLLAVPPTLADHLPRVRRELELRLGPDGTDVLFGFVNAATAALTLSPTAGAAEAATRSMLAAEAWRGRSTWARHEAALGERPDDAAAIAVGPRHFPTPPDGPAERYANRAGAVGIAAAGVVGLLSRSPDTAGAAALAAVPKPLHTVREAFGCAMSRGLSAHHDALVLRPRALRVLDRVDAIMIDPRALYTDELTVSRVLGVDNSSRSRAWQAVRDALDGDGLAPGWHQLADIPGAGEHGEALVSPVRDPFAAAVLTEARQSQPRIFSLDDDGLRSLAQGFDQLYPTNGSVDHSVAAAVAELKAGGLTVALLTTSEMRAAHRSDVTIAVLRDGHPAAWGADVLVSGLTGAWRLLHALPAARAATGGAVRLSASASVIGALMLIPGVPGRGSTSTNVGMAASLWFGYRAGAKVFRDSLPEPETVHDWHGLPVAEVQRLLPRPSEEHLEEAAPWQRLAPVRALGDATAASWRLVRDFAEEMRENLADPITPLLATGALASALLGSPLDAALVGSVLLVNAALSSEQQLHAERILNRLLAVQEPPARRRVESPDEPRTEKVPATRLRPGDVIEVHADEVVPADARLLHASNVEVDEATLTGESLPVAKQTEATPGAPLAERTCMLYAGTTLVAGTAVAVVTAVGSRTEMRRALAMAPRKLQEIGLQRQLRHITGRALPFSVASGGMVGALSVLRGTPLREAVSGAVTLIVAAIPEGLPLVATLAQLAAARRLTGESVLIRNPHSVEALARLNVVCFDKTGTLSENRLKVKAVRPLAGRSAAEVLDAALTTSYSRHTHRVDHATDDAVHRAAGDPALRADGSRPPPRRDRDAFLPFQSGRPFAAALVGTRLMIKGSPEVLASALVDDERPLTSLIDEMAADGLRVLAVAERRLTAKQATAAAADPGLLERLCTSKLTPIGLLGLADTLRAAAPELLADLARRDIGVRLITGDHPATAAAIARELGMAVTTGQVITGGDWEALSADDRAAAVRSRLVFARMSPENKIDVVQTLERVGLVTAMVGDGVNDAAAIRAASVGVGVAARGSDSARTAADVVLLDERIEALLDALDEGQQLWRRVQSAVSVLLGGNLGEVSFALLTTVLTGRSVLNARQMLLVNMLTDALPAAALAVSPQQGTAEVDRDEAAMWRAIAVRGASTTAGATLGWAMASVTGTPRRAATVGLIALVSAQLAQTLVDSRAPLVVLTTVGSLGALVVVVSTPGLSHVFGCTPVDPLAWGQGLLAASVATSVAAVAPDLLARTFAGLQQRAQPNALP